MSYLDGTMALVPERGEPRRPDAEDARNARVSFATPEDATAPRDGAPGLASLVTVVPVFNGGDDIGECLAALLAAGQQAADIVVVDDASTDGAAERACAAAGCRHIRLEHGPNGPARARNVGAASRPDAELYLFVDADVTVYPETIRAFRDVMRADDDIAAAFGSYDDDPSAPGWISRYKNLLHHWMHQRGAREASTFWSGCGVVRGTRFRALGGFDEGYGAASIEDIDLGLRLSDSGERVRLCPDIHCTHHKHWTLKSWLKTDIHARALPWSRLLVERGEGIPDNLNLGRRERLSAVLACLVVLSAGIALASVAAPGVAGSALAVLVLAALGFVLLQRRLLAFFARAGGVGFAVAAAVFHLAYFVYSSIVFAAVKVGIV